MFDHEAPLDDHWIGWGMGRCCICCDPIGPTAVRVAEGGFYAHRTCADNVARILKLATQPMHDLDAQLTAAEHRERALLHTLYTVLKPLVDEKALAERVVPMLLECPGCGERHIDEGEFATKVHHTHACQHCRGRTGQIGPLVHFKTAGVNDGEFAPSKISVGVETIARRAGGLGHNREFFADEAIE